MSSALFNRPLYFSPVVSSKRILLPSASCNNLMGTPTLIVEVEWDLRCVWESNMKKERNSQEKLKKKGKLPEILIIERIRGDLWVEP